MGQQSNGVDVESVTECVEQAMAGFYVNVVQPNGKVIRVVADKAVPVIKIKHEVARVTGVEARKQQLKAGGEDMKDEKKLRDYGITQESVVFMETEGETGNSLKNVLLVSFLIVILGLLLTYLMNQIL
ncbi:uncharacterized protein LOC134767666 [Penaeus indicus]|uniref:uncharacterized protein LOC134767666 n=1 Tax=Penaeus indicus TaxID=29960 RepID=UPI00300CFCD3